MKNNEIELLSGTYTVEASFGNPYCQILILKNRLKFLHVKIEICGQKAALISSLQFDEVVRIMDQAYKFIEEKEYAK